MEEGVCQGLGSFLPWSGVPGWDAPLSHLWGPVSLTGAACAVTRSPAPWTPTSPVPTEAAFTLLLYCELLQWEERPLREFLHYPSQPEWQRKEGLCRKVIHYFNKGKVRPPGKPSGRPLPRAARLLDGVGVAALRREVSGVVSGWTPVCAHRIWRQHVFPWRKIKPS